MIAAAIVKSRLDSCNSLVAGTSNLAETLLQIWLAYSIFKIHSLGMLPKIYYFCRMMPILSDLHRLPVHHRINFKIATITFKVL